MTRPGGVTPSGLPYPGSSNIHAETPAALQALAEAITGKVGMINGGATGVATFTGTKALTSVSQHRLGRVAVTFPELRAVDGLIGMVGPFLPGGIYRWGWVATASSATNTVNVDVMPVQPSPETFAGTTVALCLFAWGPKA